MQLPLNVSPVSASFIGLQRLGIHLVLSLACLTFRSAPLLFSSLHATAQRGDKLLSVSLFPLLPSAKLKYLFSISAMQL